uniref:Uncharacterized protein n=1 Tax=Anguilla anguilla TaxID=7936 RepID=A0A0E9PL60_ANGAN
MIYDLSSLYTLYVKSSSSFWIALVVTRALRHPHIVSKMH